MIYVYKNDNNEIIEKEYSMNEEHPSFIIKDGVKYYRDYSNLTFNVPYIYNHPFKFDYSKSISGRKHFY